jgi:hypothetical protein
VTVPIRRVGVAVAVTLGVVAALLTATLTALGPSDAPATKGAPCGTSICIPNLKFDEVIAALKGHGYTCAPAHLKWTQCSLKVGITTFDFAAEPNNGLISRLGASVKIRDGAVPLADKSIAFVQWVAVLPIAPDQASMSQVQTWVEERIKAGRRTEATINGYKYTLTFAGGLGLDLDISYDIRAQR